MGKWITPEADFIRRGSFLCLFATVLLCFLATVSRENEFKRVSLSCTRPQTSNCAPPAATHASQRATKFCPSCEISWPRSRCFRKPHPIVLRGHLLLQPDDGLVDPDELREHDWVVHQCLARHAPKGAQWLRQLCNQNSAKNALDEIPPLRGVRPSVNLLHQRFAVAKGFSNPPQTNAWALCPGRALCRPRPHSPAGRALCRARPQSPAGRALCPGRALCRAPPQSPVGRALC